MRIFNLPAQLHLATFLLLIAVYLVVPVPVLAAVGMSQGEVMEGEAPMPQEIWHSPRFSYAVFVASDRLLSTEARTIDRSLLLDAYSEHIEDLLTGSQVGECIPVDTLNSSYDDEEPQGREGLDSALSQSAGVVVGRVTGWQTGVSSHRPGTLYRLAIEEVLKGEILSREMYVFFPTGDVELGGQSLCVRNRWWPDRPALGNQVLVMLPNRVLVGEDPILLLKPSSVITFEDNIVRRLPHLYRKMEPHLRELSTSELLERVRSELKKDLP